MKEILRLRDKARMQKNWKLADSLRDKLKDFGISIQGFKDKTDWYKM